MVEQTVNASVPPVPNGVQLADWLAIGAKPDGEGWKIPERDASGEIVGWFRRFTSGKKGFVKGGHRGLTYAPPFPTYAGSSSLEPVLVVEGQSDTAAGLGAGLTVVGRPGTQGGGDALEALLKDRHVVFVAENDGKDGENGPGAIGAQALANRLTRVCASVRVIRPPAGVKDLRDWIIAGASRDDVLSAAKVAPVVVPKRDEVRFDSSPPLKDGVPESKLNIVSIAELSPGSEPEWLWKGYIARGAVTLFTGLWKAGKSTLLAFLLRDLYRGGGLAEAAIGCPTLLLSEEPEANWSRRRDDLQLSSRILFVRRPTFARPDAPTWRQMIAEARKAVETMGICLVVFDTLPSLWPVVEENSAGEMLSALTPLRDLAMAGAAVLLVCHPRKNDGSQGTATRGSGALPSFVDVIVELRRHSPDDPTDRKRLLTAYGRFEETPAEQVIELGEDGYRVIGDRREVRARDAAAVVADVLPSDGRGLTAEEILEQWPTGSAPPGLRSLRSVLSAGATNGRWKRNGTGHKGDPYRFRRADSIPADVCRGPERNRIPSDA